MLCRPVTCAALLASLALLPLTAAAQNKPAPRRPTAPAPKPKPKDPSDPTRFFDVQEWELYISQETFGGSSHWGGEGLTLFTFSRYGSSIRANGKLVWEQLPPAGQGAVSDLAKQFERLKKMGIDVPDVPKETLNSLGKTGIWAGDGPAKASLNDLTQTDHTHNGKKDSTARTGGGESPVAFELRIDGAANKYYLRVFAYDGETPVSARRRRSIMGRRYTETLEQVPSSGEKLTSSTQQPFELFVKEQPLPASGMDLSGQIHTENQGVVKLLRWTLAPVVKVPKLYIEPADRSYIPEPGAPMELLVRWTGGEPTELQFDLSEVSTEKGTHLNSEDQSADPDVEFAQGQAGLMVTERSATAKPAVRSIKVLAKDYGAYARIKAKGLFNGRWIDAECPQTTQPFATLPPDGDGNRVADAWDQIFGKPGAAADSDEDEPKGQANLGDGLTYYEEYRGLQLADGKHVRLDPKQKELCVVDPSRLLKPDLFQDATEIRPVFLKAEQIRMGRVDSNAGYADGKPKFAVTFVPVDTLQDDQAAGEVRVGKWGDAEAAGIGNQPIRVRVFRYRIQESINRGLYNLLMQARQDPQGEKAKLLAANGVDARLIDQALQAYQNSDNTARMIQRLTNWVALHELTHACGVGHHEPDQAQGAMTCPMRVISGPEKMYGIPRELTLGGGAGSMPAGLRKLCRTGDNCWSRVSIRAN